MWACATFLWTSASLASDLVFRTLFKAVAHRSVEILLAPQSGAAQVGEGDIPRKEGGGAWWGAGGVGGAPFMITACSGSFIIGLDSPFI